MAMVIETFASPMASDTMASETSCMQQALLHRVEKCRRDLVLLMARI